MKNILIIGAGLSSSYLIKYLLEHAQHQQWFITIADANLDTAAKKANRYTHAKAVVLDVNDISETEQLITTNDLVISMLPASMHVPVAQSCIKHRKHLITASYISPEMRLLHTEALAADVLLLNECGLDPGIDHISAMKMIHTIQNKGGHITEFKSYCGGLVAPEFDNNPWHYKFTWNPRNVVLAGQSTARYLENDELKFIPPSRIFSQIETVNVENTGIFECYANRDSLEYIKPYGIENAHTVLRGTIRNTGYCSAWDCIVKLGLTDDSFVIHDTEQLTYRDLLSAFTPGHKDENIEQRVASFLGVNVQSEIFEKLKWLGLFETNKIILKAGTPAQILQSLLQQKWKLNTGELDMIIMHHILKYEQGGEKYKLNSSLVVKGENETLTAMAKTVGLPMAIAAKLLLTGKIKARGVQMPILPELYNPILEELATFGIVFHEQTTTSN